MFFELLYIYIFKPVNKELFYSVDDLWKVKRKY